ncbi:hypothetical protein E2C01_042116 [Portunus trituberculatus]|uniref:Uncharacterized protein n=1 Tax=Portunus trituberculatus TaxID=210409 RepID=A0A5B7FSJ7_PORTR|nr:hypothetical protein [Portunus trituberculatus]
MKTAKLIKLSRRVVVVVVVVVVIVVGKARHKSHEWRVTRGSSGSEREGVGVRAIKSPAVIATKKGTSSHERLSGYATYNVSRFPFF